MRIVETFEGTQNRRLVVELEDSARIETVLYRGDTLCVSSQVGCAVRCPFCASGVNGLGRNLSLEELKGQVALAEREGHKVDRVTVSGVGEPLHNATNVRAFIEWCRTRRIAPSLTTSGATRDKLFEALQWPHNGLTVSVHAGTDRTRAHAVPHGPTLADVFAALADAHAILSQSRKRKVALAYLLLRDLNDSDAELNAFIERALPLGFPVHLYAYNPVVTSTSESASRERYEAVYALMSQAGLLVRMSSKARTEQNGGCGTLVAKRPAKVALKTLA